jgi:proline iminopeptidase
VWLARAEDLHWWYYGARAVFPDVWEDYANAIPPSERHDLRKAYNDRILGSDAQESRRAALVQYQYEYTLMQFHPRPPPTDAEHAASYGRVYAHYSRHDFFLEDNQLLRNAGALRSIPLIIIGARYDCCTPFANAYDLSRALPEATLLIASAAGHLPDGRQPFNSLLTACALGLVRIFNNRQVQVE